jgi:hypothetical protein
MNKHFVRRQLPANNFFFSIFKQHMIRRQLSSTLSLSTRLTSNVGACSFSPSVVVISRCYSDERIVSGKFRKKEKRGSGKKTDENVGRVEFAK